MGEALTFEQAQTIDLPRNPFRRHKVVREMIKDLKMPGVDVSYIGLPIKGRRDLEEYAIAHQEAIEVRAEDPTPDSEVVFGTSRGGITVHPMREGE